MSFLLIQINWALFPCLGNITRGINQRKGQLERKKISSTGLFLPLLLFLPFLLVDIVVASVTTSIGMLQLPPVTISTPLKILLFVMVDGWNLLAGSLLKSF